VTTAATIANVAPVGSFNASPNPASEGVKLTLSIQSVVDPGTADLIQYAFDCGDGKGYSALGTINSRSCNPADNGSLTVKGKVQDDDGGVSEYTGSVTVNNVAPTATFGSPAKAVNEGSAFTLSMSNPKDVNADLPGLQYAFDCGY